MSLAFSTLIFLIQKLYILFGMHEQSTFVPTREAAWNHLRDENVLRGRIYSDPPPKDMQVVVKSINYFAADSISRAM